MNNIGEKYRMGGKYIYYRDTGEVLSIPPMSGIILTPKSVHTVKAPSYVILTVIYVAVTVTGRRQPKTRHTQRRRGYRPHRRQTQYGMKGG